MLNSYNNTKLIEHGKQVFKYVFKRLSLFKYKNTEENKKLYHEFLYL